MQRRLLACGFVLSCCLCPSLGQDVLAPPPGEAELTKAETLIQELYRDDFTKAKSDRAAQIRLAQALLQEGKETADLPAGRYRLLMHARDLASRAGDGPTALQAIEELAQSFRLPAQEVFVMKIGALALASKSSGTPEGYQTVLDSAMALLEDALALDDFAAAGQLLATAEAAGIKLRSVPLVAGIRKRHEEVAALEKEYAHWRPFAEKLAANANDPQANLELGKYIALIKGDWDRGLGLLARGNEGTLSDIANAELAGKTEPRVLGQGWQKAAAELPAAMRSQALLHAYFWYQKALADAREQGDVQKHLEAITKLLPPELRVGEITSEWKKCDGHFGPVYGAAFSPDGKKAISGGADGTLRLWDTKTGKELRRLDGHSGRVWCVAFAPDGRKVASGGFDGSVRVWDLVSGRETRKFLHNDYVRSVAFSQDGRHLLSGGDDKMARLWNIESGKEERAFKGHDHFVWSVALWSEKGEPRHVLTASLDKTVRLWDAQTGEELKKLVGHKDTVLSVVFAPEGRRALSGSTDKTIKLWNLETGDVSRTFTGHKGYVHSVAFSPDGKRVLSASQDNTVRLWDVPGGEQIRVLEGHRDQVWFVSFSRNGRLALSAGQDNSLRLWASR